MNASRDVTRLIEIMEALRSPVDGCPWDVEQTFDSIVPYTLEEAYEVADAIERRDAADLCEELGDLLLQVVYHAQMASEAGLFSFDDVVEGITGKMIRRHPHVFGDAEARSARSAKGQWERIKSEERAAKAASRSVDAERFAAAGWNGRADGGFASLLDAVPGNMPALTQSLKIQQKAATVGFDWDAAEPIHDKIAEELEEFASAVRDHDRKEMAEELGDVLFSVVNLARFHEIDPEDALRGCAGKFRRRFRHIEERLAATDRVPTKQLLPEMEMLWTEAKSGDRGHAAEDSRTSG